MKSEALAVVEQLELAERMQGRLGATAARLVNSALAGEERGWIEAAERRLLASLAPVRTTLEQSLALPELKALRAERVARLEQEWLQALRALFDELVQRVGANSPLIEALFPHQRFERIERPGAAQRAFRAEFSTRRSSTYVQRMALDPEYPFLAALLAPIEAAEQAWAAFEPLGGLGDDEAERLRAALFDAGQSLSRSFRQARALCEAALMEAPELFSELGFDPPARKRAPRAEPVAADVGLEPSA